MPQIRLPQDDAQFLRDLQNELLTQPNDGNADPVFWGVMETKEVGVPDGCGDPQIYLGDGGTEELEGAVAVIGEYISDGNNDIWNEVDKTDMDAVVSFCNDVLHLHDVRIVYVDKKSEVSRQTGAFLTKRACQEYISRYGYNHSRPHTYAMTAYRNYELARLLKILKTMEIKED